jgi:hypothetical protein
VCLYTVKARWFVTLFVKDIIPETAETVEPGKI